jgi:hypothetical protein
VWDLSAGRTLAPKREKIAYCGVSLNIIRTMKMTRMSWVSHVAHMKEKSEMNSKL